MGRPIWVEWVGMFLGGIAGAIGADLLMALLHVHGWVATLVLVVCVVLGALVGLAGFSEIIRFFADREKP